MTKKLVLFLLLTLALNSFGQGVRIDTLLFSGSKIQNEFPVVTLKFPIVKTGTFEIDTLINEDIKNRFTANEFMNLPTDLALVKWADDSIVYLDFEVTYNKNELVSLNISAEGCGANCTMWTSYFTYSTKTGTFVAIDEIVTLTDAFRRDVIFDKDQQYDKQKKELKDMLDDSNSGLDAQTYSWVLENYETCKKDFTISEFALYEDHLEFIHECHLPRAIRSLSPIITLKYNYDMLKHLLIKPLY